MILASPAFLRRRQPLPKIPGEACVLCGLFPRPLTLSSPPATIAVRCRALPVLQSNMAVASRAQVDADLAAGPQGSGTG